MTEKLTRQQRRALDRQKHHKHIIAGSYFQATKPQSAVHPITNKPLFEVIRIEAVTHKEISFRSPYGNKGYMPVSHFEANFVPLTNNAEAVWQDLEAEATAVKGQQVLPDEVFEQFLARNPEMRERLVRDESQINPLEDVENNLVVKEV